MANQLGPEEKIFETPDNPRLNGQPAYRIRWDDVVYEPGELKVVAYKDGRGVGDRHRENHRRSQAP